jgi:hypothetical protein
MHAKPVLLIFILAVESTAALKKADALFLVLMNTFQLLKSPDLVDEFKRKMRDVD